MDHATRGAGSDGDPSPAGAAEGGGTRLYWAIGILLAVVTAVEVYVPGLLADGTELRPSGGLVAALLAFAFVKAGLVAAFYMHLRYDSRWYSAIMALAAFLVVYFLWLLTFGRSPLDFDWFDWFR